MLMTNPRNASLSGGIDEYYSYYINGGRQDAADFIFNNLPIGAVCDFIPSQPVLQCPHPAPALTFHHRTRRHAPDCLNLSLFSQIDRP